VIRFLYCCPWSTDPDTNITTYVRGALLAAFRSIETNEIVAVHRMRLDQPERWPKIERKMYGPKRLAAVKLAPAGDTLAIGEGVETCLAAMQLGLGPAWALGSAGAIRDFPVLPDVSTLLILAENDATNAAALQVCGRRWRQAGRRVRAVYPEIGSDLNDVLMGTQ